MSKDHVHIFLSVPPHLSLSQLAQSITRGYFVASSGILTDEVTMKDIEQQGMEPPDAELKIDEGL